MQGAGSTGSSVPVPIDSSYQLVFDDEFSGTSINPANWYIISGNAGDGTISEAANVSVSGGQLHLADTDLTGYSQPYQGGMVSSTAVITPNAYVEALMRPSPNPLANDAGLWQTFFLYGTSQPTTEMDVTEWLASQSPPSYATYHDWLHGNWNQQTACAASANQYHVFSVWWTTTVTNFYVDGVLCQSVTPDVTSSAGQVINIQSSVSTLNGFGCCTDANTIFPTEEDVEYVHAYIQNGTPVMPEAGYGGPGSTALH
jgi:beta-glucanase (GH16 family)